MPYRGTSKQIRLSNAGKYKAAAKASKTPSTVTPAGHAVRSLPGPARRHSSGLPEGRRVARALRRVRKAYKSGTVTGDFAPGERKFVNTLSRKTGLSPRVVGAWVKQEGGGDQDYNVLNIGRTDSGALGLTGDATWQKPKSAAKATAKFLKGKAYGASPGIRNILPSARGKSPQRQIEAIARSGWATDPAYEQNIKSIASSQVGEKPKVKPKPKDLKTLKKAGVPEKEVKGLKRPGKRPFGGTVRPNVTKIVNPKWDSDSDGHTTTEINKAISPVIKRWSRRYGVTVGAGYDPGGGHVSPGHNAAGTATDVYPSQNTEAGWDRLEKGLKVLVRQGFEVGYGTNGVGQAWPNHGRGNHAHIEWVGQGSSTDAIRKLAGLTNAEIARIESSGGSGGGSTASSGGASPASVSTGAPARDSKDKKAAGRAKRKAKLRRVQAAYSDTSDPLTVDLSELERKYGVG